MTTYTGATIAATTTILAPTTAAPAGLSRLERAERDPRVVAAHNAVLTARQIQTRELDRMTRGLDHASLWDCKMAVEAAERAERDVARDVFFALQRAECGR